MNVEAAVALSVALSPVVCGVGALVLDFIVKLRKRNDGSDDAHDRFIPVRGMTVQPRESSDVGLIEELRRQNIALTRAKNREEARGDWYRDLVRDHWAREHRDDVTPEYRPRQEPASS